MPRSKEAQQRATAKYQAANVTQVILKLNNKTDADILTKLESVGNKQGYIKALIRADIAQGAEGGHSIKEPETGAL